MLKRLIAGAALLALAAPLAAQTAAPTTPPTQPGSHEDPGTPRTPLPVDRGYDKPQVRTEAINAPNRGEVAAANSMTSGSSTGSTAAISADLQAQYDADMAAWVDAMRSRDSRIAANARQYDRQQRAYADAMYVWRMQARDCERGYQFACNRPTPNPADFMR
ncbi:hypothetical protein SCH01S_16_00280 [Sphingomonas changbaiensis NBRC 104936]|uniref:Lysozyme inhibitor LprI N-terminal domain-containing protein n=1 Tax=Sphingomonas changbaiensis NBRC 104936 TaxID=1219043 RepID=A0A0E9MM72_9SPHN|nr:hypothetical protein [Sphingomonas changbaiensis]GAO38511.1 hypothetical protein SCH01S_16_00280 [Sphingomonas changbaiensis NBRC 104936]